jgi:hypothetical protein
MKKRMQPWRLVPAAMAARGDESLVQSVNYAATARAEALRKEATRLRVELHLPGGGVESLAKVLQIGTVGEKQNIIATLGSMPEPAAAVILGDISTCCWEESVLQKYNWSCWRLPPSVQRKA